MRHDTIANYASSFKSEIDNDSIVYILKNGYAFAMARELVSKQIPSISNSDGTFNYFEDIVKKHASKSELKNVLYKNNAGVWIKLYLILRDYQNITQLFEQANNYDIYVNYIASKTIIPEVYFTDKDNRVWKINAKDGATTFHKKTFDYIDVLDKNVVEFVQCNMDHPEYGFTLRHLMSDLKIIFKKHYTDNVLITINGRFVNPEKNLQEDNVLYIRNARYYYTISNTNLISDNTDLKESITNGFKNASLELEEGSSYSTNWLIDSNINIIKWHDVNISEWMEVSNITYFNDVYEYQNVRLIDYLTFERELNPKNTIILCDGVIMSENEYTIDGRKVYLKYERAKFGSLYRHFLERGSGKRSIRNALNLINNQYYHAIEFTDTADAQPLEIRKTTPVDIDIMGNGTVLFNDPVSTNDLILTDGKIEPYTIKSNGLIQYEKFNSGDLFGNFTKYTETELINVYQQKSVKLNLNKYRVSVKHGEETVVELDTDGDNYEINIENEDIVSVEKRAKSFIVTGIEDGECNITVRAFKQYDSDGYLSAERTVTVNVLQPILTEINIYIGRDSRTPIENDTIEIPFENVEKTIELIVKTDASDFTFDYDETEGDNSLFIVDKEKNHIYIDTFLPNVEMQGKVLTFSITAQATREWEYVEEVTTTYRLIIQESDKINCYVTDSKSYKNAFQSNIVKFDDIMTIDKPTLHIPSLPEEHEKLFKLITDADSFEYELIYDNPKHAECWNYFKVNSDKNLLPLEVTDEAEESRIYDNVKVGSIDILYSGFSFTPFCSAKLKLTLHKENREDLVKEYNLLGYLKDKAGKSETTKDICIRINEQETLDDSVNLETIYCSNKEIGVYRVNSDPTRFSLDTKIKYTFLTENAENPGDLQEVSDITNIPVEVVPFQNAATISTTSGDTTTEKKESLSDMQTSSKYPTFGFAFKYKPIYIKTEEPKTDEEEEVKTDSENTDEATNEAINGTVPQDDTQAESTSSEDVTETETEAGAGAEESGNEGTEETPEGEKTTETGTTQPETVEVPKVLDTSARFEGYVRISFITTTESGETVNESVTYTTKVVAEYKEDDEEKNIEVSNIIPNYGDYFYNSSVSLIKYNNGVLNKLQNPDTEKYNDLKLIITYTCIKPDGSVDDSNLFSDKTVYELVRDEFGNALISVFIKRVESRLTEQLSGTVTFKIGYGYEPKDVKETPDTIYNPDTVRTEEFKFLNKDHKDTIFNLSIIKDFSLTDNSNENSDIFRANISYYIIESLTAANTIEQIEKLKLLNNLTEVVNTNNNFKYEINNELAENFYGFYNDIVSYDEIVNSKDEEAKEVKQNRVYIHGYKTYRSLSDFKMSDWETDKANFEEYNFVDNNIITASVKPSIPWLSDIELFPSSKYVINLTNYSKHRQRKYANTDLINTTEHDIVVGHEVHIQVFSDNSDIVINSDEYKDDDMHVLNTDLIKYAIGTDFLVVCAETMGTASTCIKSYEEGIYSIFKKEIEFSLSDKDFEKTEFSVEKNAIDITAPFFETIKVETDNIDDYDYTLNNDNISVLRDKDKNLIVYGVKKGTTEITLVGKKEGMLDSDPIVITVTVSKINGEDNEKETLEFIYPLDNSAERKIDVPFYKFSHDIDDENIIVASPTDDVAELQFAVRGVGSTNLHVHLLDKNIKNKRIERLELVNFYEITDLD